MAKSYYMLQCLLAKANESGGSNLTVAWLPEKYAIKGKVLKIESNGEWEDGWVVDTVYKNGRYDMEKILLMDLQSRNTRKVSDI